MEAAAVEDAAEVGAQLFFEHGCSGCHGPDGRGGVYIENAAQPEIPPLRGIGARLGLSPDQIVEVMSALSSDLEPELSETLMIGLTEFGTQLAGGGHPEASDPFRDGPLQMPSFSEQLTDSQVDALTVFLLGLDADP